MDMGFLSERFYTIKELADRYKTSEYMIKRYIKEGRFSIEGKITTYRLTDSDPYRVTQTGVDAFDNNILSTYLVRIDPSNNTTQ